MPGISNARKRTSSALGDYDEVSEASFGSSGGKRARHDASESPAPTHDSEHDEETHEDDAYQPGSIVRVKLTNFVTYTAAEFHLGPSLNMIIGPNGTGKSTLNLGRAKEIGEFVKHGSDIAEIEIELAASAEQQSNPIIRRVIRKEGNKSTFYIGRRSVTQKEVTQLAKSFSIQIDNLCQFLPQDRVVEFAKLEPIELLMETQRAAAPEYMVEWHNQLKDLRKSEKQYEIEHDNESRHLKGLQDKQNATRSDVEKWNERQKLVATAEMLEKCRPIILAKILAKDFKQVRAQLKSEERELRHYLAEVEPAQQAQQEMQDYRDQIKQIAVSRKRRFEAGQNAAHGFIPKIDEEQQKMATFVAEIDAEKDADKQRKHDIKRLEGDISRIQSDMEQRPVNYDPAVYEERFKDVRARKAVVDGQEIELKATMGTIRDQVIEKRDQLQRKANERSALDTQSGQQGNLLKQLSADTYTAWDWLEKNKAELKLRDDVYAPPILSCSVPDARFAAIVESQLRPRGDLTAITCMNQNDTKIVADKLLGKVTKGGLGLHNIVIRTAPRPLAEWTRPVTDDVLRNIGFDGWIIDHIKGPEPVLSMLCQNAQLSRSAYALKPIPNAQFEALPQTGILKCVNGNEACTIRTRAEYRGASSISTEKLKPAQFFTDQAVDTDEKRRLDEAVAALRQEIEHLKGQHEEAKAKHQEVVQERKDLDAQKQSILNEQTVARKASAEWQALPRKIEIKEANIQRLKDSHAESYQRIRTAQRKAEESSLKVAKLTLLYAKSVTQLRALHESCVEAELRLIEADSEVEGFTSDNRLIKSTLQEKQQRINALKIQKTNLQAEHTKQLAIANSIINSVSEEHYEQVQEWSELTTEELENKISENSLRLSMLADGNPNAIKAYEKREKDIKITENKLEDLGQRLEATRQKLIEIRARWEPKLDKLVAKISDGFAHNFQQIGCAGQVGVHKDEDFEKWAIRIQVRFRENESLQILDSHRQSGGERAVSTIFYLMALQDLARSPFRVVDEINQGMDPRNERMVHERMVDIACRERTSQYFLITPKLLNDLKFHPKMKVHCIASGEHMPDQTTNLDFQKLAKVALRVRKGIAAA